jgi:hypothetical protein
MYSPDGNRKQSIIAEVSRQSEILPLPMALMAGMITDIYSVDRANSAGELLNVPGAYLTYTVKLSPTGVFIHNVPSMCSASGHTKAFVNTLASNDLGHQNTEDSPHFLGQPVIIGFINGSNFNPIILGPAPCQMNATTMGPGGGDTVLDPQTAGANLNLDPTTGASDGDNIYPQRQGSFQGSTWKLDKKGNVTLNIVSNGKLNVQVNGVPFITVDGSNNTVDIGTGAEPGVLGNTLQNFLNQVFSSLTGHTHTGGTISGLTGPPNPVSVPNIETSVLKVQ